MFFFFFPLPPLHLLSRLTRSFTAFSTHLISFACFSTSIFLIFASCQRFGKPLSSFIGCGGSVKRGHCFGPELQVRWNASPTLSQASKLYTAVNISHVQTRSLHKMNDEQHMFSTGASSYLLASIKRRNLERFLPRWTCKSRSWLQMEHISSILVKYLPPRRHKSPVGGSHG